MTSLVRKGATVFAANWLVLPLQLLTGVVIVRAVGAEGKGILTVLTTSIQLLAILGHFGMPAAAIYYLRRGVHTERTLLANHFIMTFVTTFMSAVLLYFATDLFIGLFLDGVAVRTNLLWLTLGTLPLTMTMSYIATLLTAAGRAGDYARLTIGGSLLSVVGTLLGVGVLRLGVAGAVLASALAQLITVLAAMARILRSTSGQTCQADLRTFLSLLKFGLRHHVGSLGAQLFKRGDTFLLAHFLNVSAVGYYAIALTAYELLLSVPRAISGLLAGESSARPGELAAVLVSRTARQVLWVMIIVAILVSVLAIPFVPLLYGQDFNRSVPPLLLLLAAAVSLGAAISLQAYFLGIGRPGLNGSLTLASGLANLWLSLWLIPLAGLVGNALATLLGCLLNFTLHLLWFRRLANVPLRAVVLPTTDDFGVWRKGIHRARILLGS